VSRSKEASDPSISLEGRPTEKKKWGSVVLLRPGKLVRGKKKVKAGNNERFREVELRGVKGQKRGKKL